ncbi:hypothetical protein HELRODRAFT_156075 [Helobdella robusta]|uniref:XPA C-terminal domain-containing protein n=1 Tax=Helobdella robusta TaxID=6412 RepID=T1ELR5_HELRO|nr:hypothetical protein HELRODRAFT_156075 [Helobdella robusta]ESN92541.1 hypothetical protein HELRODRAFT_156075 [Helobdella robusta]
MSVSKCEDEKISKAIEAKIERNRQRALLIRQEKVNKRLHSLDEDNHVKNQVSNECDESHYCSKKSTWVLPKNDDTGAGGFLKEDHPDSKVKLVHKKGGLLYNHEKPICEDCKSTFSDSFLFDHFLKSVCDSCRDKEEKHRLITKTEAKERYLLKDCDFEIREPVLKYVLKKNPNYKKFGEMKLYLECQVAERAFEVWGSDEKLEEEIERRNENRNKAKKKKFDRKIQDLRKSVRNSLYENKSHAHEHEFGEESYREVDDTYSKVCRTCGFVSTYEKM